MNRNEEFTDFMKELDGNVPEITESLKRGSRRKARKLFLYQPVMGLVTVFALFVLSVNLCAPVAEACSRIPVLKDLAKAVTFSKSLSTAVENEYVQEMNLKQTQGDITAEIAYLIVDQKQVNVFYRFESDQYEQLNAHCSLLDANGEELWGYSLSSGSYGLSNEELRCATADFSEINVPDVLHFQMKVFEESYEKGSEYIEEFDFLLEFDPTFTAKGKIYPVNQTMVLDGQTITVKDIEVYPTHMRVNVEDAKENTAWLRGLKFYIETGDGMQFTKPSVGISATGAVDSKSMVSYYAESPYFYDAKQLRLVVTGAQWLDKGRERIRVDLETGESEELPENVTLKEVGEDAGGRLRLWFEESYIGGEAIGPAFGFQCYDATGEEYGFSIGTTTREEDLKDGELGYVTVDYSLEDYPHQEIWLETQYTRYWKADKEIIVEIR